ncbi:NlpC/P60 family protein [Thalassococcus sp. BH17M4-6]|uniref:C40 family peptidase n=1 Tax=Thalassococcus sp. BH17M4-6 TaxID=3413148 RepID=UPI003BD2445C
MTDRRLTPFSGRVAHESLRGRVEAESFTSGDAARVVRDTMDLLSEPDLKARGMVRQLRMGDRVTILDQVRGLVFLQSEKDGYCGWARHHEVNEVARQEMTHVVQARASHLYRWNDMKTSRRVIPVTLGARMHVVADDGRFATVSLPKPADDHASAVAPSEDYFIPSPHLRPVAAHETDPVTVAERLLGAPYLWGGNSSVGIDCSGLIQLALSLCGVDCPGDSDLQEAALGTTMPEGTPPRRGDLLFWKGHVAWVSDPATLLHANAHAMAVCYEPMAQAIARIAAQGDGPVTRQARL